MSTKTVYAALLEAVRTRQPKFKTQYPKETDQAYITRILAVVAEVDQEAFDAMGTDAQVWFDDAAAAVNAKKDAFLPDGFPSKNAAKQDDAEDEETGAAPAPATADETPAGSPRAKAKEGASKKKDARAAKTDKKTAAKKTAGAKKARPPSNKKDPAKSVTYQLRLAFAKNPQIEIEQAEAQMKELGFTGIKTATITTILYDARTVAKALQEVGWRPPA